VRAVPEGWDEVPVGSLATFSSGKGISIMALHEHSADYPIPVYGGNGVSGYTVRPITDGPTVVVGRVGQKCGEVHISEGPAWVTDNALYPVRLNRPLDINFLGLALKGASLNSVKNRNDLPLVTQSILHSFRVAWPRDLAEQRAIVAVVRDLDAMVGSLDRLIAKRRNLAQAVKQKLLTGRIRLPEFCGNWDVVSVNNVAIRSAGFWGSEHADDRHSRLVEVIRAGDISNEGELVSTAPRFFSNAEYAKASCQYDDVVLTASGTVGKVWWCNGRRDTAASNFVRVLRPIANRADGKFLSQLFRSDATQRLMTEHITTGVMANLGASFFSTPWLRLPEIEEQRSIAKVLSDIDAGLTSWEKYRNKTHALKMGVMQELLTGRTRLV
jgi:type I restriction enzyme S subunit